MAIEELSYASEYDIYGNIVGLCPPSKREIVDKINEIIRHLNKGENHDNPDNQDNQDNTASITHNL